MLDVRNVFDRSVMIRVLPELGAKASGGRYLVLDSWNWLSELSAVCFQYVTII